MNVKTCLFLAVCLLVTGVFSASLDAQATLRNHWTFDGNIDDEGNVSQKATGIPYPISQLMGLAGAHQCGLR